MHQVTTVNCTTGETTVRDATPEEIALAEEDAKAEVERQAASAKTDEEREKRRARVLTTLTDLGLSAKDVEELLLNG